jgi:hypothetical protein
MSVILKLPPETELILKKKAAHAGQTLEAYLEQLAERHAQVVGNSTLAVPPSKLAADQWVDQLRAWAASHRALQTMVDDSRETIYEGRGE